MADPQPDSSEHDDRPGKTRTMWHPLLVRLLNYTLASAFTVTEEVSVGKMPLRVDILLVRRKDLQLLESRSRELAGLLPLLNRFTLIEFKSPNDTMKRGDFAQLLGCAMLWHSQEDELIPHHEVSLIVLAPTVTKPLRDELQALGFEASQHEPGIFRVVGVPFAAWLVETDVMAERGEPVLSLVSRTFLNDRQSIIEKLASRGFDALAAYRYMVQEVKQFRSEEDFAMQQALSEHLEGFQEDLVDKLLEELPAERRLRGLLPEQVLHDEDLVSKLLEELPAERRLRGLLPEQVMHDEDLVSKLLEELPAERRLRGLLPEQVLRDGDLVTKLLEELPAERRLRGLLPEQVLRDGDLVTKLLEELPAERRLRGLLPEQVLRDGDLVTKLLEELPAERRLRGLSPQELAAGLTDDQAATLRELLERKQRP
jgi:hypothetical protein